LFSRLIKAVVLCLDILSKIKANVVHRFIEFLIRIVKANNKTY
jgi:hypothetical protein